MRGDIQRMNQSGNKEGWRGRETGDGRHRDSEAIELKNTRAWASQSSEVEFGEGNLSREWLCK